MHSTPTPPCATHPSCHLPCVGACAAPGGQLLSLSEVLASFEREAVRGVLDTGRYRMPYFAWGAGPPLVFVHGVSDSSRSFLLVMARLSRHFRCVGYDLPGNPGDGADLGKYRHAHLVEDLIALLDHLALPRAYVLGSSFGSTVALAALRAHPERLPRAVLQGALAHRPLRRAERFLAWVGRFFPGTLGRLKVREKVLREVHGPMFEGRPEEVWQAFLEWTGQTPIATLAHQVRWLHGLDLRPVLPEVRQPVLLVSGDRDRTVPPRLTEEVRQGLPAAGQVVIEGCGHLPAWTHPEVFAEVVRQFLTPPGTSNCPPACAAVCPGMPSSAPGPLCQ